MMVRQTTLLKKVIVRLFLAVLFLGAIFFIAAGTLHYWEAWVYLACIIIPATLTMLYLMKKAPDLLERRMRTGEKKAAQKLIITLSSLFFSCFRYLWLSSKSRVNRLSGIYHKDQIPSHSRCLVITDPQELIRENPV